MPRLEETPSERSRPREVPQVRTAAAPADEELSEDSIRAIEEGRVDHAAGRTFTIAEIKRGLGIDS